MSALGQGFQDQLQELKLYKERYEKLKHWAIRNYYPHLSDQEFDQLVDKQRGIEEVYGYPV